MKKLYLHIGLHKTGSTAIQHFLWSEHKSLNKLGISYPSIGIDYFAHQDLAYEINNDSRKNIDSDILPCLIDYIETTNFDKYIISSENFEFSKDDDIKKLKEKLKEINVELYVICYLRAQEDFLISEYNQRVKHGYCTQTFTDFVDDEIKNDRYFYTRYLKKWSDSVNDNLIVRFFDKKYLVNGDAITDFIESVCPEAIEIARNFKSYKTNTSPNALVVETLRQLAIELVDKQGWDRLEFSKKIAQPVLNSDLSFINNDSFSFMNDSIASKIRDKFYENNCQLENILGIKKDSTDTIFSKKKYGVKNRNKQGVEVSEIIEVLTKTLLKI